MQGEHKLSHQHSGVAITKRDLFGGHSKISIMIIIIIVLIVIVIIIKKENMIEKSKPPEITLRAVF